MILNLLILTWLLFIVVILYFISKKLMIRESVYSFQNHDKVDIIYITIDVQGNLLNLLVDTGCGVSIITKDALQMLSYDESKRRVSLEALTSDSLNSGMVTIPITVNNRQIDEDFVVYDKKDIANFQAHYGITLHGILGTEFLKKTGCKIDYKKHAITLS